MSENNVPHICARCATCGIIFDATKGFTCPNCLRNNISYAWKSSQPADFWRGKEDERDRESFIIQQPKERLSPYPHILNGWGTDCSQDCPACAWVVEQKRTQPAIDELDRIFSLIDPRK